MGNFKNIAFTVASRHQRLICYDCSAEKLLGSALECGPADEPLCVGSMPRYVQDALLSHETTATYPTWVKYSGQTIKRNAYVITRTDGLHPKFARIVNIIVILDIIVLQVLHCIVDYFDDHYHAYVCRLSSQQSYVCFSDLKVHSILHAHQKAGITYIYLKQYFDIM